MITTIAGINIQAIATCVPTQVFTVEEYCPDIITPKEVKRLIKYTGFEKLRIIDKGNTSDLCMGAVNELLKHKLFEKQNIDAIIFISQTPDYLLPATSHILQDKLGLRTDIIALDVSIGCSGYIYGLNLAASLIASKQCKNVLLLAGDTSSKKTNPADRATRTIFGDAGSATIISSGNGSITFNIDTYGAGHKAIIVDEEHHGYLHLDGVEITDFALNCVPVHLEQLLQFCSINKNNVDTFVLHQANKMILASLADKMDIAYAKMPFALQNIGNTSSATIPLVLTEQYTTGQNLNQTVLCGFGVGLSLASALGDLSQTTILKTVEL